MITPISRLQSTSLNFYFYHPATIPDDAPDRQSPEMTQPGQHVRDRGGQLLNYTTGIVAVSCDPLAMTNERKRMGIHDDSRSHTHTTRPWLKSFETRPWLIRNQHMTQVIWLLTSTQMTWVMCWFLMSHGLVVWVWLRLSSWIPILFRSLVIANGSQLQYQSYSSTGKMSLMHHHLCQDDAGFCAVITLDSSSLQATTRVNATTEVCVFAWEPGIRMQDVKTKDVEWGWGRRPCLRRGGIRHGTTGN